MARTWWLPAGLLPRPPASIIIFTGDLYFDGLFLSPRRFRLAISSGNIATAVLPRRLQFPRQHDLEIVWTVLTTVLFVGMNLASSSIWASERFRPAGENAVTWK